MPDCFWTDFVKCAEDCGAAATVAYGSVTLGTADVFVLAAANHCAPADPCTTVAPVTEKVVTRAAIRKVVAVVATASGASSGCGWNYTNYAAGGTPVPRPAALVAEPLVLGCDLGCWAPYAVERNSTDDTLTLVGENIALVLAPPIDPGDPPNQFDLAAGSAPNGILRALAEMLGAPADSGYSTGAALFYDIEDLDTGDIYAGAAVSTSCF